jgi:O-antigen chain-terminating methyltransferase
LSAVAHRAKAESRPHDETGRTGHDVARLAEAPSGAKADPTTTLSHRYVGFEDQFRGSPEAIRKGLAAYVPIFAGAADVLDIGCGRGEFLDLLREQGITGQGIDLNGSMVDVCREKGLAASQADALTYLRAQPDGALGGLFAAQVVEHLEPAYLTHLLDAAFAKLRPGSPIVLETINPACWFAFFESYIRDITHVRPLHPDTLTFLLVATGFQRAEIRYSAPYPEHEKLQPVAPTLGDAGETINANVEKINALLFTHLDYAAIAYRP